MAKGVIYITTTSVEGLIKIGKTRIDQFKNRMTTLEQNGYWNVSGLKRFYAVEVEDYSEKEKLIHKVFSKSQVSTSELFALDTNLAKEMLDSFEGKVVYPPNTDIKNKSKAEIKVNSEKDVKFDLDKIPDGEYFLEKNRRNFGIIKATMIVKDGKFILKKGSICSPIGSNWESEARKKAIIKDDILQEDIVCKSPSNCGEVVLKCACNGWISWKTKDGESIDIFRKK